MSKNDKIVNKNNNKIHNNHAVGDEKISSARNNNKDKNVRITSSSLEPSNNFLNIVGSKEKKQSFQVI